MTHPSYANKIFSFLKTAVLLGIAMVFLLWGAYIFVAVPIKAYGSNAIHVNCTADVASARLHLERTPDRPKAGAIGIAYWDACYDLANTTCTYLDGWLPHPSMWWGEMRREYADHFGIVGEPWFSATTTTGFAIFAIKYPELALQMLVTVKDTIVSIMSIAGAILLIIFCGRSFETSGLLNILRGLYKAKSVEEKPETTKSTDDTWSDSDKLAASIAAQCEAYQKTDAFKANVAARIAAARTEKLATESSKPAPPGGLCVSYSLLRNA